jgi:UDP-N-acetylmuramoyl-tripeptide--D-alanyl-D-alanine ligase
VTAGMGASAVRHCQTSEDAAEAVATLVRPGDVVLVKGSRSVRTDRVVDRLKAERA